MAIEFCNWLNYKLPTVAQLMVACPIIRSKYTLENGDILAKDTMCAYTQSQLMSYHNPEWIDGLVSNSNYASIVNIHELNISLFNSFKDTHENYIFVVRK